MLGKIFYLFIYFLLAHVVLLSTFLYPAYLIPGRVVSMGSVSHHLCPLVFGCVNQKGNYWPERRALEKEVFIVLAHSLLTYKLPVAEFFIYSYNCCCAVSLPTLSFHWALLLTFLSIIPLGLLGIRGF